MRPLWPLFFCWPWGHVVRSRLARHSQDELPFSHLRINPAIPSLDWAGRGAQIAIAGQLRNAKGVRAFEASSAAEAVASRAEWILSGYLARDARGPSLHYVVEDAATHRVLRSAQVSPVDEADMIARVREVGDSFSEGSQPVTKSVAALKAFAAGQFEEAVREDPAYGEAWVGWASRLAGQGQNDQALSVVDRARSAGVGKLNAARLKALEGQIKKDRLLLRDAAIEAAELAGDAASLAQAAQAATATRDFARAENLFRRALEQEPNDENMLNLLAYTQAYQAKIGEALRTIERYRKASSDSPNSIDSQGEIQFMAAKFADAAKSFELVHQKAKDFLQGTTLRKAAVSYLSGGQLADAQRTATEYLKEREGANDPLAQLNRALWEYHSARPADAYARLTAITRREPKGLAAIASVQLALLRIEDGDFEASQKLATQARQLGVTGQPAALAALCLLISEKDEPLESLKQHAEQVFRLQGFETMRQTAIGLALLYRRRFPEAVPFLKEAFERSEPGNETFARETYAWALIETGRFDEAKPLLAMWSPPPSESVDLVESLVDSRAYYLRAILAEKEGRTADAAKLFELFIKCHGARPDRFGHMQKAKSAVTL